MEYTELCKIAYKYKTDKCPQIKHPYTPVYDDLFKGIRNSAKKVLEVGIAQGASLYTWRDYFPKATIYGIDIKKELLFKADRIKTFVCDERKKRDVKKLIKKVGSDIDIFIDDGSHLWEDQASLANKVLPLLDDGVIYIIEDVIKPDQLTKALSKYECTFPRMPFLKYKLNVGRKIPKDRLMIVKNK